MVEGTALLVGDLDVAYPLRAAGIDVTVLRGRSDPSRFSRAGVRWVERRGDEDLVTALQVVARRSRPPVVLYVQQDHDLLEVSARRGELAPDAAIRLPSHRMVCDLLDKARFQSLAEQHGLPIPPAMAVSTRPGSPLPTGLEPPVILKPLTWPSGRGHGGFAGGKAVVATDLGEVGRSLEAMTPYLDEVFVQQLVPGPESAIESYHVYVGEDGRILGEFTGRKLRTTPREFGYTTAAVTTDHADVRDLGRRVVDVLGLRGVAKIDLKRDPRGVLWLLEINARNNLWHRLGAIAGCNLPAIAFEDVAGHACGPPPTARAGVTWSRQPRDLLVARAHGVGAGEYLRWLYDCDAVSGLRLTDPMPSLGSWVARGGDARRRAAGDDRTTDASGSSVGGGG